MLLVGHLVACSVPVDLETWDLLKVVKSCDFYSPVNQTRTPWLKNPFRADDSANSLRICEQTFRVHGDSFLRLYESYISPAASGA